MNSKEFFGMKYPFGECKRPELLKAKRGLDCSVRRFCEAPEKIVEVPTGEERRDR